jgi:hypothetical protein
MKHASALLLKATLRKALHNPAFREQLLRDPIKTMGEFAKENKLDGLISEGNKVAYEDIIHNNRKLIRELGERCADAIDTLAIGMVLDNCAPNCGPPTIYSHKIEINVGWSPRGYSQHAIDLALRFETVTIQKLKVLVASEIDVLSDPSIPNSASVSALFEEYLEDVKLIPAEVTSIPFF